VVRRVVDAGALRSEGQGSGGSGWGQGLAGGMLGHNACSVAQRRVGPHASGRGGGMGLPGTKGRGSVMGRRTPARWGGRAWGYRPLREIVGARPMSRAGGARGWAWVARAQWRWVRRRADHGEHVAGDPEARAGDHAPTCRRVGRWPLAAGGAPSSAISWGRGMTATAVLVARARRRAAGPAWSGTGGRARRAGVISGPTAHQRHVGRPSVCSLREIRPFDTITDGHAGAPFPMLIS